ncbi:hypothetical protein PIB30_082189 [Stylosanthes scabra]|uniref:Uncharacterized protein n=1 Tax=Stylosanthes scabra TaxID=79078 RepID=A0ABU6UUI5_9FABA|nr:hypothetical protein [Stylosanthes scabra]
MSRQQKYSCKIRVDRPVGPESWTTDRFGTLKESDKQKTGVNRIGPGEFLKTGPCTTLRRRLSRRRAAAASSSVFVFAGLRPSSSSPGTSAPVRLRPSPASGCLPRVGLFETTSTDDCVLTFKD